MPLRLMGQTPESYRGGAIYRADDLKMHKLRVTWKLAIPICLCIESFTALSLAGNWRTPVMGVCPGTLATSESGLSSLKSQAADYCDSLSHAVLDFVCRERIEEWFYGEPQDINLLSGIFFLDNRIGRYKYIYDYQLIRDRTGHIRENRTLLQEEGKKVELRDAPLNTHVIKYAYVVMGPLGLLSRSHQADFDYKITREEKLAGEPTVVIEAIPKPGVHPDYLYGTIWLRKSDAGILKVQWNPASMENYASVEDVGRKLRMKPDILMTSEYAFEKNGIRFPSRYNVKERYLGYRGRFERSETDVIYDQYKFFTVETEVKY